MNKYLGLFLAIVFFSIPPVFSQETVTITTYYPSPAGVYNELLVSNRMAVGDTNGDGVINNLDLPTDAAGNPLPNSFQTVNSLTDRQVVGDVNGDGAINGLDLPTDSAGNPLNNTLATVNSLNNRMAIGDVNGDGVINDFDLAHNNAVPPQLIDGSLTVANTVGIGTTTPQGELHVHSTDNTTGHANIILEGENPNTGASTGTWDIAALGSTGSNGTGANAGALQFNSTTAAGVATSPVTVSQGAPNNSIFVASNGNVGIGTDDPRGRLDVNAVNGNGTYGAFIPPAMTSAQRDSINPKYPGMIIYNTTTGQLEVYNPTGGWGAIGGVYGFGGLFAGGEANTGRGRVPDGSSYCEEPNPVTGTNRCDCPAGYTASFFSQINEPSGMFDHLFICWKKN
ncbi:MAG: hypothetical protein WC723_07140 [Candidatus Omnitrophota bacterium]